MNKTAKPPYVPEGEVHLWKWFDQNQENDSFTNIANVHKVPESDIRKLKQLWSMGARESFNQAYYSMFEGSPTMW